MDIDYDENMGNPPRLECYVSISRTEELFGMTEKAFPWELPTDGDHVSRYASRGALGVPEIDDASRVDRQDC
eukprot:6487741-Prymnesium_polylepis.1